MLVAGCRARLASFRARLAGCPGRLVGQHHVPRGLPHHTALRADTTGAAL